MGLGVNKKGDWVPYNEHDELVRAMRQIEELEGIARDALDSFLTTQRLASYPAENWSNRAAVYLADHNPDLSTEHVQDDIVDTPCQEQKP